MVKKQPENKSALHVMKGVEGGHDGLPGQSSSKKSYTPTRRRSLLSLDEYVKGVLSGDRTRLARAITLVESNAKAHFDMAQSVIKEILPKTGSAIRVGISGVPGAGKSTFIEALGTLLTDKGLKVAVTAVDPSSSVTGGSIMGDKTRMEQLSANTNAFIRPSPSSGALGGVARKTRETMLLFEAAGYDVILVETVGVGQSEITVRSMVDFFLLVLVAGAGDELQGIKKGVVEIADAILINKADGDNKIRAEAAKGEYEMALHYLQPATEGWKTHAYMASSLTGEGIEDLWNIIKDFENNTKASAVWEKRRKNQAKEWIHAIVNERLREIFLKHPEVEKMLPGLEVDVMNGQMPATSAAKLLLELFEKR